MRGVGGVRRASEAEQCGLADNIKEHNLSGASANLVPATPHTQPSIQAGSPPLTPASPPSSLSLRQISNALSASQRYCVQWEDEEAASHGPGFPPLPVVWLGPI